MCCAEVCVNWCICLMHAGSRALRFNSCCTNTTALITALQSCSALLSAEHKVSFMSLSLLSTWITPQQNTPVFQGYRKPENSNLLSSEVSVCSNASVLLHWCLRMWGILAPGKSRLLSPATKSLTWAWSSCSQPVTTRRRSVEESLHPPGPETSAVRGGQELTCLHTCLFFRILVYLQGQ